MQIVTPRNRSFKMASTPSHGEHYRNNCYEDFTADLLVNLTSQAALFIDIGAHYGYYSLLIGTAHPHTRVIAFEPAPENFRILQKGIEINDLPHVKAFNYAVSNRDGSRAFLVAEHSSRSGFYPSHLSPAVETIEVKTVLLDPYLNAVPGGLIVIKTDTVGHEYDILDGLHDFIQKESTLIRIVMEFHPEMLTRAGYSPELLLEKLNDINLDIHFLDDEQRRAYKFDYQKNNWKKFFEKGNFGKDYCNILLTKRRKSLSRIYY